jgi:hypothetical protein
MMSRFLWQSLLRGAWPTASSRPRPQSVRGRRRPRLLLEALEDRLTPTVYAVTNTNSSGPGSLAYAVAQANASTATPDSALIEFTGPTFATPQTITPAATLELTRPMEYSSYPYTINGPAAGVTISGGGPGASGHTVFEMDSGVTASLSGLTITGGVASVPDPKIQQNASYPQYAGGGIYNAGTLSMTNCVVENNTTNYAGGGIYSVGPWLDGIYPNPASVTLTSVTISGNKVASGNLASQFNPDGGAGICVDGESDVSLAYVTVSDNIAIPNPDTLTPNAAGGGILNNANGLLQVDATTLSGNSAAQGAGIFNAGPSILQVWNSTISGNTAVSGGPAPAGGGIYNNNNNTFNNDALVLDSTFAGNSAQAGGGIFNSSGLLLIQNTIVAGNAATASAPDFSGAITNALNDLLGDGSGASGIANGTSGNIVGASADLAPLANYGGPTQTMAPLPGSPALGAGTIDLSQSGITTDQRGYSRTNAFGSSSYDIGALQKPSPAAIVETSAMQDMSLWPSATTLHNPLGQGEVVTLQPNGQLTLTSSSGMTTLLDNQTRAIVAGVTPAGQPALFDLKMSGVLYQYSTGIWTLLDNFTANIVGGVTSSGQPALFDLETTGNLLYQYGIGGWTTLDNQAVAIFGGVTSTGLPSLFDLKNGGTVLYQYSTGGWTLLDDGAGTITTGVTSTGQPALFDLKHSGKALYQYSVGGWSLLDDGAGSIFCGMTTAGQPGLFDLKNGMVYQYSVGGWTLLDDGAGSIFSGVTATGAPALFDLKHNKLYQYSIGGWTLLDDQAQTVWNDLISVGSVVLYDLKNNGHVYRYALGGFTLGA